MSDDIAGKLVQFLRDEIVRYDELAEKFEREGKPELASLRRHKTSTVEGILRKAVELGAVVPLDHGLALEAEIILPKVGEHTGHEMNRTLRWYKQAHKDKDWMGFITSERALRRWVAKGRQELAKEIR